MKTERKKKLNKPKLQLRMIGVFVAISCFAAIGQALLLAQSLMNLGLNIEDPTVRRTIQEAMPGMFVTNLILTGLFLLPFSLLVGIHVTHRIAGPAQRIEKHLQSVAKGSDPKRPCVLRNNDELQELSTAMNEAFSRLSDDGRPKTAQATGA
ncbi:MAG: HAMP domain-containing protein [bacterium]|nr:HAMP domain-containing protein [bacterium]